MKVWLPSHTLSKFARTVSMLPALIGLTTFVLISSVTSNCFSQFTAIDSSSRPDEEQSILVSAREEFNAVEPQQIGATPRSYNISRPTAGVSARPVPQPQRLKDIAPPPTARRIDVPQQAKHANDVITDHSVSPATYAAPVQGFPNQSRRPMQSLQPRQNASQANLGQLNRNEIRRNQVAQNAATNRQATRSAKKTSASAKVLIARFGYKGAQENPNNSDDLVPLRLADVLNQGRTRANRGQLIDQYWQTFAHWAKSVSAKQHRDWVNGLRVSKSTDQSTIGVAKSNAENEVTANRIELAKSQRNLMSLLGSRASIVPADLPTVTMVKTNFQAFKQRGLVPARLENIDQTLKDLHDLVLSRADTVLLAERTAEQVEGYYKSNRATIEQLLGAGRDWQSAEVDFVDSTIQYNKAYADYALSLPYGQAPVEQVVAMLVVPTKVASAKVAPAAADQDLTVRAASVANGFGQARAAQSRPKRPMPDFSKSPQTTSGTISSTTSGATGFGTPKTPEFHANSPAPQRPGATSRRDAKLAPASLGGGSANTASSVRARNNNVSASGQRQFGSRTTSAAMGFQPGSGLEGGKQANVDFSNSKASVNRPPVGFSSAALNGQRQPAGQREPAVDPFSTTTAPVRPATKPPVKPNASFDAGGSGARVNAATATATGGFSTGFGN